MAEESESAYIEGFNSGGKDLSRITRTSDLLDLLRETNAARNSVDNTLSAEQDELQKLQNTLNHVNEEFLKKTNELEGMKRKQQVSLDQSRKNELSEVMRSTLDNYLERRPTDPNDKRSVHVNFLTGEEFGSELHVGVEGAGSRDAVFIVTLSQSVQSLATQAAKYWGLDPEKVFFLDRDGRIVQPMTSLSDIILPPLPLDPEDKKADATAIPSEGSTAIVPAGTIGSGSALAIPKAADDQIAFTVKGRDYSLTLVRAKTVLTKEDLSQPKGEEWNDFTFDQKRLNDDLEMTRKKRGDPEPADMKVSMDTIPSLYDLINKGNERTKKKNKDKWCRIIELMLYWIMGILFIMLMNPNSERDLFFNYAGRGITRNLTQFSLSEQAVTGINSFSDISSASQYEAWVQGPLRRAVFPWGLDKMNAYVLKVQGRVYREPTVVDPNKFKLNWCGNLTAASDANVTNSSNSTLVDLDATATPTCIDNSLQTCPSKGVVELMAYAMTKGQDIPACRAFYDKDPFVSALKTLYSMDAFSFVTGRISSYSGGELHDLNMSSSDAWNTSAADFLPSYTGSGSSEALARLVNVVTYVPVLGGIQLSQFLTEFTLSGPVLTTTKSNVIRLDENYTLQVVLYPVCLVLSLVILLMELSRITAWPAKLFFAEKKEACGLGSLLFVMVPVFLSLSLAIKIRLMSSTDDIMKLTDYSMMPSGQPPSLFPPVMAKGGAVEWTVSEKMMAELQMKFWLGVVLMLVDLINFLFMMLIGFRYALVYFPQMKYTTEMIRRVTVPVLVNLLMLILVLAAFNAVFFLVFSDQEFIYRNWLVTTISVVQFAHGGFMEWEQTYKDYAWTWYFLMLAAFLTFTLNLNNILIAVLVSHKKEAELHKNYSSHPFWQMLHRDHMQYGEKGEVNPALAGFDFGDPVYKDGPKKVTEAPGLDI